MSKQKLKFKIRNKEELNTKKWIPLPGHPDIAFLCSQALNNEILAAVDKSKRAVYLQDGSIAMNENGVIETMDTAIYTQCNIEIICNHVHDWKGHGIFVDSKGHDMPYSPEAMEMFLHEHGRTDIINGENETTIREWIKSAILNPESFIQGDVKNLKAS